MLIIVVRFSSERFVFKPIGIAAGLKDRSSETYKTKKSPNAICSDPRLDLLWKTKKNQMLTFSKPVLESVVKELGSLELSQRQLERWIRRKANSERSSRLERFTEGSWRMIFYAFAFCFGIFTLWDKEWFWDSDACLKSYPCQAVSDREWWYYNIEIGFYLSHLITLFTDAPQKDFMQMLIHHLVTIMLLVFSWTVNFVRMGTLVLVIHDFADVPLEAAKLCRYLKVSPLVSNSIFGFFALYWIVSRLGVLPYRVIIHTLYYALVHIEFWPVYWIFNALLIILQILHVIWTFMILRIVYNTIHDTKAKDIREYSSLSSSAEDDNDVKTSNGNFRKNSVGGCHVKKDN